MDKLKEDCVFCRTSVNSHVEPVDSSTIATVGPLVCLLINILVWPKMSNQFTKIVI